MWEYNKKRDIKLKQAMWLNVNSKKKAWANDFKKQNQKLRGRDNKGGIIVFLKMRNKLYTNRDYILKGEEKGTDIGDVVKNWKIWQQLAQRFCIIIIFYGQHFLNFRAWQKIKVHVSFAYTDRVQQDC